LGSAMGAPNDAAILLRLSSALRIDRDPDCLFSDLHHPETLFQCVPGVSLTRVLDRRTVEARMVVGVGPFAVAYDGVARIVKSDRAARTASIDLEGLSDIWGTASARMRMSVRPVACGSSLNTSVRLTMTGRATAMGRQLLHHIADEKFTRAGVGIKSRLWDVPPPFA
jgi:carbon monoxide dehydrogenase subunit G